MSTIVLRNIKGSPLTFTEMDNNFTNLNNDKLDVATDNYVTTSYPGTVVTFSDVDVLNGRFEITAADTGGYEAGAHHLQVQVDFITTTYLSKISGHFGIATHTDNALIGTAFRGNGVLIGTVSNGSVESSDLTNANIMLETWMGNSAASQDNIVYPGSDMPIGYSFTDGKNYRVVFDSIVDHNDKKWMRYRVWQKDATWLTDTIDSTQGFWDLMWDSGYWYDSNLWADFSKTGIWLYEVYSPSAPWSITFSNAIVRWGPYLGQAEEATARKLVRTGNHNMESLFGRSDGFYGYSSPANDVVFMTGFNNTSLRQYAGVATSNFNWADWCDVDDVKNKLVAAGMSSTTATQVEGVVRPLYCLVGLLYKKAKQNGW